jgi:hypothetical protein
MRSCLPNRLFRAIVVAFGSALSLATAMAVEAQVGLQSRGASIQLSATMHAVAAVSLNAASNGEVVTLVSMNTAAAPEIRVRLASHAPPDARLQVRTGDAHTTGDVSRNFMKVAPAAGGEIVFTGGGEPGAVIPVEYEVTSPSGDSVARWFFSADIVVIPAVRVAAQATRY